MNRTKPLPLLIATFAGLVALYLVNVVLAMRGVAVLVPPVSLAVALALIAVLLIAFSWPVRIAAEG